jgi:hypothetical protein
VDGLLSQVVVIGLLAPLADLSYSMTFTKGFMIVV